MVRIFSSVERPLALAGRRGLLRVVWLVVLGLVLVSVGCSDSADPKDKSCGDGVCDTGETSASCPKDCTASTCGNNVCDASETSTSCPADCAASACGNGVCENDEDATSCAADCSDEYCGDGLCEASESTASCPMDCPASECGNGLCEEDEDATTCSQDCSGQAACYVAQCEQALAVSCDGSLELSCSTFGGTCGEFIAEGDDRSFSWCTCGPLAEGKGQCLDKGHLVLCLQGMGVQGDCLAGTFCQATTEAPEGVGCFCDDLTDGICPDEACINDPDCQGCVPSCGNKECGSNGCGGSCGSCELGQNCVGGTCQGCVPNCSGRECGSDGCGGSCGTCSGGESCNTNTGVCESQCVADCSGRVCGTDGCGGSCGDCPQNYECSSDGTFCDCDFFSHLEYTFDASGVDWSSTNYVSITAAHIGLNGSKKSAKQLVLLNGETSGSLSWAGACQARLEVTRVYSLSGGYLCDAVTEEVQSANITVPSATHVQGSTCNVPSL